MVISLLDLSNTIRHKRYVNESNCMRKQGIYTPTQPRAKSSPSHYCKIQIEFLLALCPLFLTFSSDTSPSVPVGNFPSFAQSSSICLAVAWPTAISSGKRLNSICWAEGGEVSTELHSTREGMGLRYRIELPEVRAWISKVISHRSSKK